MDEAEDGSRAVTLFSQSDVGYYSLILMDVKMPVMDGHEATRAIRAAAREDAKFIPIVALSANAYEEDAQLSLSAGMNSHLAKPVDINELKATLLQYIAKQGEKT